MSAVAARSGSRLAPRQLRAAILGICALALVLRLAVVIASPHFVPQTDSADYDREAVALARYGAFPKSVLAPAGGPTAFRPPIFPLALGGAYAASGTASSSQRWIVARVGEAVLGVVLVALIYLVALRLFGPTVALISAAAAAVYPPLVLVGSSVMSEPVFLPLLLGSVLAALAGRDSPLTIRWALLTGFLVGLCTLSRSIGILIALPLCGLLWTGRPRLSWRVLRAPLALVLALVVTIAPWTVRNILVFHAFVPVSTEAGYDLAGTYESAAAARRDYPSLWLPPVEQVAAIVRADPMANEAQISTDLTADALRYIRNHVGYVGRVAFWSGVRMLGLEGAGLEHYWASIGGYPPWLASVSVYSFWGIAPFVLIGLASGFWRRAPGGVWAIPALLLLITILLGDGGTRYRSPADPFLLILAAGGALAAARWLQTARVATTTLASL